MSAPRPFAPPGTPARFTPDRPVSLRHLRLEAELDFAARALAGRVTLTLEARAPEVTRLELDAVELDVRAVAIGDAAPAWQYDGQKLRVRLPQPLRRGESIELTVEYRAVPRRGLYFLSPDAHVPGRPVQCWTQGQDEDARHFVPCIDVPIEKATTEVICVVPHGKTFLSNGDLVERRPVDDARERWHYRLEAPQPSYLLTLVCGDFVELRDRAPRTGVEVYYYAPPGREADARRSLGKTPAMIDTFSERIGVAYPHKRYSQIVVADFIFGGMENTTATTLTDLALIDERAALDHDSEALVAHELAHQWWGDLVTCREWSEAWLNEGFATYFEYIWREHDRGRDEADLELRNDLDAYVAEAGGRYERPVVCRHYEQPIDLFDAHLYEKGGRVLHMVRDELGDELFFGALRLYLERHRGGSVETRDLSRALEDASGRGWDGFFAQWVQTAGHPEIEGSWEWDDDRGVGTLRLKQTQAGEPFRFSLRVRFELDGKEHDERVQVRERSHAFELKLAGKPTQVIVDPGDVVLKQGKIEKPRPLWMRQLAGARLGIDRVLAAKPLAERADARAVAALREALEADPFWGVRAAAAAALGSTRRQDALDALLAAREQPHPRVRRAVAAALGEFRGDERAAQALARWLEGGDPSYFVEAASALALGRTRSPRAIEALRPALTRESFQDVIRSRALDGLGETGAEPAQDLVRPRYDLALPFQSRRAAIAALVRLTEGLRGERRARELAEVALDDPDFRVRIAAAIALAQLGDARAVDALERAADRELDGRARRRMREAVSELRTGARRSDDTRRLRDELDRLATEVGKLRERIENVEGGAPRGEPPAPATPPPSGKAGPKPPARRAPRPARPRPATRRTTKPPRTPRR